MKFSETDHFEQCYQCTMGLAANSTSTMMLSALGALLSSGSKGRKGEKMLYTFHSSSFPLEGIQGTFVDKPCKFI